MNRPKRLTLLYSIALLLPATMFAQHFTTTRTDDGIEILENGKKVLTYQDQPRSLDGKYQRAGYIHPLYSLAGNELTENFPEDHPYHRGIFWTWHQILLNHQKLADGWVSENVSWTPAKTSISKTGQRLILGAELQWESTLKSGRMAPIIKEKTKITVYAAAAHYRMIDFDIRVAALIDSLQIGGSDDPKGYGGFCLRLKLPADISFISEDKIVKAEEQAVAAGPWLDFNGSFDGREKPKNGVAVLGSPLNPEPRQQWILRKEKSMQNIVYPGRAPVPLTKKGLWLRYRLIIHDDTVGAKELEQLYQQYAGK
jgi:hypothetical protein